MALRIPGKGRSAPELEGVAGDLLVVARSPPDPRFERRGPGLWRVELVDPGDAMLGTSLRVPILGLGSFLESCLTAVAT